jgi:hypothetical protein
LLTTFDRAGRKAVFMTDTSQPGDPQMDFYFSDQSALRSIRFRSFLEDCNALGADVQELDPIIERERQSLSESMESACHDVLANYKPKIVSFPAQLQEAVANDFQKSD